MPDARPRRSPKGRSDFPGKKGKTVEEGGPEQPGKRRQMAGQQEGCEGRPVSAVPRRCAMAGSLPAMSVFDPITGRWMAHGVSYEHTP